MQEIALPFEAGFVVDWQITDDHDPAVDLSMVDTEVILPDPATVPAEMGLGAQL